MHVDPAIARTNCGICAAELAHAPALCYLCATPFHTSCISSSIPGPATPSPPTDGYDWFCSVCVETRGLDGSLFRSPVPPTNELHTQQNERELPAVRTLTTSDDPRHPAEADTTPPIPSPPSGGNPARSPVEDVATDAVPIYLATKHNAYAPSKWRLLYLFMRRHYVEECLSRTPTGLTGAVRHHSTMSRYALFHLFRPRGALTQDEPPEVFDTHDAVEQHDAGTDERQRSAADASAQR